MAKRFIAGIGWIETDDLVKGAGAAKVSTSSVSQEEKTQSFADTKAARDSAYGSPEWVKANFPEYADVDTSVKTTTGGQMGRNGIRAPSVTRTVAMPQDIVRQQQPWTSLGFRELWESTPADQRGALADTANFYRNGGKDAQGFDAIDPKNYNGLTYEGKDRNGRKTFSNEVGTLKGGQHPQQYDKNDQSKRGQEYGINSTFVSHDGSTRFQPKYYATVLKDFSPDKRYSGPAGKIVPGWNYIAKNLGLSSYQPGTYTGNVGKMSYEFSGMDVGSNLAGHFGYMWDRDVETRRNQRDAKRPRSPVPGGNPPGGGGGGGGGGPVPGGGTPGGGQPPPGTQPPITDNQQPNTSAPPRGPVDYGPAPFNPYPGGDPYGGHGYSGHGDEGYQGYQRPIFGGDSQWTSMYNNWLSSGIDIGQYAPPSSQAPAPPAGPPAEAPAEPPPAGGGGNVGGPPNDGSWDQYYQQWLSQ